MGKMCKLSFKSKKSYQATCPLEIIHSDIGGPITLFTQEGYCYCITFIDCYTLVCLIKQKSNAQTAYNEWYNDLKAFFYSEVGHVFFLPNWLHFFCTDGGSEYTGRVFQEQLRLEGTFHKTAAADTPEQKGPGKHSNGTIATHVLAMLIEFSLSKSFWGYGLQTAAYLHCRSTASGIEGKTPYKKLFGCKVDHQCFYHSVVLYIFTF